MNKKALIGAGAAALVALGGAVAVGATAASSASSATCNAPSYTATTTTGTLKMTCNIALPAPVTKTVPGPTTTVTQPGPTTTVTVTATPTDPTTDPTPTPTDTTTPPATGGFPDATNTGTPVGTTLHACATNITVAGTYNACQFSGDVEIRVAGVVITNSKIDGGVGAPNDDLLGAKISDTTVDCHCMSTSDSSTPTAIMGSNFTLTRVNLFDSGHGVAPSNNVVIQDSYIHGLGGNTQAHKDAIYVGDGSNVKLLHNNIECNDGSAAGCTSAIGLLSDFGTITNYTIDNNLLNTIGAYCFYGGGGPQKPYHPNHISFTNNHFGRKDNAQCGFYGPVTYFDVNAAGNVWSGNVWDDTGAPVNPVN